MSKNNGLLTGKQVSFIAFFSALTALIIASSGPFPAGAFIAIFIILFVAISFISIVIKTITGVAKIKPMKTGSSKRRSTRNSHDDLYMQGFDDYEQDNADCTSDPDMNSSDDSSSSSCESSSD